MALKLYPFSHVLPAPNISLLHQCEAQLEAVQPLPLTPRDSQNLSLFGAFDKQPLIHSFLNPTLAYAYKNRLFNDIT